MNWPPAVRSAATGKRFEIVLEAGNSLFGKSASGAPFHVYTPGKFRDQVKLRTRAYAVSAGDRLTDSWDLEGFEREIYHLRVCGPNGFLREFSGTVADPQVEIQCEYTKPGDIELRIVSHAERQLTLVVKDHGYKTGHHSIVLQPNTNHPLEFALERSHHWYDFSVTIGGADPFLRRFAGRVETGESGFTDPVMGQA